MSENFYDYAFLDENNVVINVNVFAEHDADLIEVVKNHLGAVQAISCDEFGVAAVGGTWNGQHFLYEDGTRVPPTHMPVDPNNIYSYDFELNEWVIVAQNKLLEANKWV